MAEPTVHNYSTYSNRGCRCEVCGAANREYTAKRRRDRFAFVAEHGLPANVRHGEGAYTNWGCRCPECTKAVAVATLPRMRRWRAQLREAEERAS